VPQVHLTTNLQLKYEETKQALELMGAQVFECRPNSIELSAKAGSLELTKQVLVDAGALEESSNPPACLLPFGLRAAAGEAWYPVFEGAVVVVHQPESIKLALQGTYRPPVGFAGQLADLAALHILAEQSLRNLLTCVAGHLIRAVSSGRDLIGHPYS